MDATTPLTPDAQRKQDRARKRKAILAGGVVLGLGAAVTLAAWSDDVFADGTFATGTFELQGAVDAAGTAFADYDGPAGSDEVGGLTFAQDPMALTPNIEVFAPISLRLSPETNVAAETVELVSVTTDTTNALNNNLAYAVYAGVAPGECTADFTGTPVTGGTGTISDAEAAVELGGLAADEANVHQLCLGVTLTSNEEAVQGEEATVTWQFNATSVE